MLDNAEAQYINELAARGALMTQSFAITHPSEPNYVALFSGDTQGVTDDSCPHSYTAPELASALKAANVSFAIYSESMPAEGFTDCGSKDGLYRRKHNPVPDFTAVPASANKPFSAFPVKEKDFAKLPAVSFVVPNMMNDMHDGTVTQADSWLKTNLAKYAAWAQHNHSLLILTWDEDDGSQDNQVMTVILGQSVKPGRYSQHITHYDLLHTLAHMYGAKQVGHAAEAQDLQGMWR
jgi:acid phosphatase